MLHVKIPAETPSMPLPFYLAMEEYVLSKMNSKDFPYPAATDCFFTWQVGPSVIFGRNQVGTREVDVGYCRANGIGVYRRKSGGGCVYADGGNIMLSYVTRRRATVEETYQHYTSLIVESLRSLGINAEADGRNDILVDSLKVSGNAYYRRPEGSIVHGTMLFDTDMTHMTRAITPSLPKLGAKGVSSVSQHITTIGRHTDLDINSFIDHLTSSLCHQTLTLTAADVEAIEELSKPYFDQSWLWGFDRRLKEGATPRRVDGAGEFLTDVRLNPATGLIDSVDLAGDFFLAADLDNALLNHLQGVEPTREALSDALSTLPDASRTIVGLTTDQLIDLLIS